MFHYQLDTGGKKNLKLSRVVGPGFAAAAGGRETVSASSLRLDSESVRERAASRSTNKLNDENETQPSGDSSSVFSPSPALERMRDYSRPALARLWRILLAGACEAMPIAASAGQLSQTL